MRLDFQADTAGQGTVWGQAAAKQERLPCGTECSIHTGEGSRRVSNPAHGPQSGEPWSICFTTILCTLSQDHNAHFWVNMLQSVPLNSFSHCLYFGHLRIIQVGPPYLWVQDPRIWSHAAQKSQWRSRFQPQIWSAFLRPPGHDQKTLPVTSRRYRMGWHMNFIIPEFPSGNWFPVDTYYNNISGTHSDFMANWILATE